MASKITTYSACEYIINRSSPEPMTGCWLWEGSLDRYGYGRACYKTDVTTAHRISFKAFHGPIPKKNLVQHTCDTPACVNPDHLILGTPLSNMQDKVAKGRLRNQHMNKTHCIHGHEFTAENTDYYCGKRCCRTCRHIRRGHKKIVGRRDEQAK